jgi:hypothetical protein
MRPSYRGSLSAEPIGEMKDTKHGCSIEDTPTHRGTNHPIARPAGCDCAEGRETEEAPAARGHIKYLSEDQLERFFAVIENPRDVAIFRMIYHRGLRERSCKDPTCGLESGAGPHPLTRMKGSHGGEYHLTSRKVRALRAWLKIRGLESGPLFRLDVERVSVNRCSMS